MLLTDSAQALTHGSPIGPLAMLARLHPSIETFTAICPPNNGHPAIIGQMQFASGERSAHLTYLMPNDALGSENLTFLLETMASQAGSWGALHLLAEIDETSSALDRMRHSGFSVYAWQRIWQFKTPLENHKAESNLWQPATSIDEIPIRNLYQLLVPPLVQSAEPLNSRRLQGWVYRQDQEIMAYVEGIYGPHGIYLHPLIHPALENVSQVVAGLLARQPGLLNRAVYMPIRSYQAWLETVVRDLECQVGPRQALMVKHLVIQQRVSALAARHSVLEKYTTEPTVPLVPNSTITRE